MLMKEFVDFLGRSREIDGYLISILIIEHELYRHGHLIEAGISDFELNGEVVDVSEAPLFPATGRAWIRGRADGRTCNGPGRRVTGSKSASTWASGSGMLIRGSPTVAERRPEWINLNGRWHYSILSGDRETPDEWDGDTMVPYPVE